MLQRIKKSKLLRWRLRSRTSRKRSKFRKFRKGKEESPLSSRMQKRRAMKRTSSRDQSAPAGCPQLLQKLSFTSLSSGITAIGITVVWRPVENVEVYGDAILQLNARVHHTSIPIQKRIHQTNEPCDYKSPSKLLLTMNQRTILIAVMDEKHASVRTVNIYLKMVKRHQFNPQ